jgi:hypothetical protein
VSTPTPLTRFICIGHYRQRPYHIFRSGFSHNRSSYVSVSPVESQNTTHTHNGAPRHSPKVFCVRRPLPDAHERSICAMRPACALFLRCGASLGPKHCGDIVFCLGAIIHGTRVPWSRTMRRIDREVERARARCGNLVSSSASSYSSGLRVRKLQSRLVPVSPPGIGDIHNARRHRARVMSGQGRATDASCRSKQCQTRKPEDTPKKKSRKCVRVCVSRSGLIMFIFFDIW